MTVLENIHRPHAWVWRVTDRDAFSNCLCRWRVVAFFTTTMISFVKPSRHPSPKNAFLCKFFSFLNFAEQRRTLNVFMRTIHPTLLWDFSKFDHIVFFLLNISCNKFIGSCIYLSIPWGALARIYLVEWLFCLGFVTSVSPSQDHFNVIYL